MVGLKKFLAFIADKGKKIVTDLLCAKEIPNFIFMILMQRATIKSMIITESFYPGIWDEIISVFPISWDLTGEI